MPVVRVSLATHAYDVLVERGSLAHAGETVRGLTRSTQIGVVTDSNVALQHLQALERSLRSAGFDPVSAIVQPGEAEKSLATVARICDAFLAARWERTSPIIALGGGIVGDVAGFAAASILRGVPLIQIPTTLLAMVDASVGGKTGVNAAAGKNLIGAFHQPIAVLADIDTLTTLPEREFISGLAECMKHDLIRDAAHFAWMESNIERTRSRDPALLVDLVAHNVAIKARVVEADPFERGERAHLNFGHTFGHGIEKASNYWLTHGECVGLGMIAASRVAVAVGILSASDCGRIEKLISAAGLPGGGVLASHESVWTAMQSDKKVAGGKLRLILPDRIGHVVIRDDVPEAVIRDCLMSVQ